jgi:uncharacterized protein YutE (UPF0331/DUF86 family)
MKGPIAIFDILGYQNFLEKNPDLKAVERVLDLIIESFWDLNKDIPSSAERIVTNTVKLFDFLSFHDQKLLADKGKKKEHRSFA